MGLDLNWVDLGFGVWSKSHFESHFESHGSGTRYG